jgi:hypothetical protein
MNEEREVEGTFVDEKRMERRKEGQQRSLAASWKARERGEECL